MRRRRRLLAAACLLVVAASSPLTQTSNSLVASLAGPRSSLRFQLSNDVPGKEQNTTDGESGSVSAEDHMAEAPTGSSSMQPYIMEFSVVTCFGKNGCGKPAENSSEISSEIKEFFGDKGDWPMEEDPDSYHWHAASPRVTPIEEDKLPPADGGARIPTRLPEARINELTAYLSEVLSVPTDVIYAREPSQSITPDDGRLRLPFAVWLDNEADVRVAASTIRALEIDSDAMRRALGAGAPRSAPGPWIHVDSWCPSPDAAVSSDGSAAFLGCRSKAVDTSRITDIAEAIRAVGPFHPHLTDSITHYPSLLRGGAEKVSTSQAYSAVKLAKNQMTEDEAPPFEYSTQVYPVGARDGD